MDTRKEANLNQLASNVHFLTAPLSFVWHALLWLLFLLLAPAICAIVPVLTVRYASPDEIWLIKWALGVLGPFASTFWFLIIAMIPAHNRGEQGLVFHFKAFGAMAFGFFVSAAAMFFFAKTTECDSTGTIARGSLGRGSPCLAHLRLVVWRLLKRLYNERGKLSWPLQRAAGEEVECVR